MGRIIAVANQKGGCGKTTTSINLSACLSKQDHRVLLIDLDPQGHATLGLGLKPEQMERTIYNVLKVPDEDRLPISSVVVPTESGVDLAPANLMLSGLEQALSGRPGREERLVQALEAVSEEYDSILLDCPPSLGLLTFNALRACREVLVPGEVSQFSLQGVQQLHGLAILLRERFEQHLVLYGLSVNFDARSAFARNMLEQQRSQFPGLFLKTVVHVCSKIREATHHGQPVIQFAPRCRAAKEFQALAEEIQSHNKRTVKVALADAVPQRAVQLESEEEEVLFQLPAPTAREVTIVGSFNDWKPDRTRLSGPDENGMWHTSVKLPKGTHHYKFLVDEAWVIDPENPKIVEDGFGGRNSVLEI